MTVIETNPAFLIIRLSNNEYVFYNSIRHRGARLSFLEMKILDMYYTYQDKEYIISKIKDPNKDIVAKALESIDSHELLNCEPIKMISNNELSFPKTYYIHLTYSCNLNCQYCYNKKIRHRINETLHIDDWKRIIDKIIPYAQRINFTGGECFLYTHFAEIIKHIRNNNPQISLNAITNGMHNFWSGEKDEILSNLNGLSFSCDSLDKVGKRIGFDGATFLKNIRYVKSHFPAINLNITTAITTENIGDLKNTSKFCKSNNCNFMRVLAIPNDASDVEYMPSPELQDLLDSESSKTLPYLDFPTVSCGAGKSVLSVDPLGNVYPCQSLHFDEFLLGNILEESIENIAKQSAKLRIPTVEDFAECSKCNVKYMCGGGCPASGYQFYKNKIKRNHLLCHMNYRIAIDKLKSLNNRLY